ncbi:MAG: 16S rRNA (guanine(527)-N(7))-methyltransferase RsmG [Deltaproteobacteria bacterium]|nr:MAG: 16S rRNA (guanine(527)-N(7))-methyltransferase RsmG [Deltaproteobacteria bacterium]
MYTLPQHLYNKHKVEFETYLNLILKWNSKINLTALTNPQDIIELHFLDSLAFTFFFEDERFRNVSRETFLDIGAGNGLPGLALKIIFPEIKLYLAESIQKKCFFIKTVIRELKLQDTFVINETITDKPLGKFDFAISRAFATLNNFINVGAFHLKQGGLLATLKGEKLESEIIEAHPSRIKLNFSQFNSEPYLLPSKERRSIIWAVKN